MRKNFLRMAFMVATLPLLVSCATIVTGTKPKVTINGDAPEPVTIKTSYRTYDDVVLPAQVRVKRKHLSGQRIVVTSDHYTYKDILIDKKTNGWAWGNIAIGGIIGWIIDLGTNAVSEPSERSYYVHAVPKSNEEIMHSSVAQSQDLQRPSFVQSLDLLPSFPRKAVVQIKNGTEMKVSVTSLEKGRIGYQQEKGKSMTARMVETGKIKSVGFPLNRSEFQPSFPCEAMIAGYGGLLQQVTVLSMDNGGVKYVKKGKMAAHTMNNVDKIRFYLPQSMEKYGCIVYYYVIP